MTSSHAYKGYNFSGELDTDDFTNAMREVARLRTYQRCKGSANPYAILPYRGIVVGPKSMWNDTMFGGFWLTDDAGGFHPGLWDFRNKCVRGRFFVSLF